MVVIGCIGALRDSKGHDVLLRAVAGLSALTATPIRLVLIGDGPLRPALERQASDLGISDLVAFQGEVADARPLYGAIDIVVQASNEEGLPNAVLEGAAAGRAIVATAVGGTPEIVLDGVTGLLVPPGDADALAAGLRTAGRRPDRPAAVGRRGSRTRPDDLRDGPDAVGVRRSLRRPSCSPRASAAPHRPGPGTDG